MLKRVKFTPEEKVPSVSQVLQLQFILSVRRFMVTATTPSSIG
ncbi:MAG TPA: hypothetical protein VK118_04130 [Tetragenococcus sp.]|nr:hypothetical protein [Tetragenococcus sp.]